MTDNHGSRPGFLGRWAARKRAVSEANSEAPAPAPPSAPQPEAQATDVEAPWPADGAPASPGHETLAGTASDAQSGSAPAAPAQTDGQADSAHAGSQRPPGRPAPPTLDSLDATSDYGAFLQPEVTAELRQAALRKLFALPSFQIRDGLDDYDDDYTDFAPLGDIITADMRHRARDGANMPEELSAESAAQARQAAAGAWEAIAAPPTSLVPYRSAGRTLVIGPAARVETARAAFPSSLEAHVLSVGDASVAGELARVSDTTVVAIQGYLGQFTVSVAPRGEPLNLALAAGAPEGVFDLVLDLREPPGVTTEIVPPGYFGPGPDGAALADALAAMAELVGEFEKPKYFVYDPAICAHGERGIRGCTRCLDTCPTGAITSIGERIAVDPHLCQGAGSCASACPTGAIAYAFPPTETLLARLRAGLVAHREAGGHDPVMIFYGSDHGAAEIDSVAGQLPAWAIPAPVEEIGMVGMDVTLAALAYGATRVLIFAPPGTPPSVTAQVVREVEVAGAILGGLGSDPARVSVCSSAAALASEISRRYAPMPGEPARHAALDEKRTALRLTLDHLWSQADEARRAAQVALPAHAPFGQLLVDAGRCTLCMACVAVCPAGALADGDGTPALRFTEWNCVQCGLCESACPEDAISRTQRLLLCPEDRRGTRTLHEEAPFDCVRCGRPFATRSVVERMTDKLKDHRMFQGDALTRLQMCEDCRIKDMYEHGEAPL